MGYGRDAYRGHRGCLHIAVSDGLGYHCVWAKLSSELWNTSYREQSQWRLVTSPNSDYLPKSQIDDFGWPTYIWWYYRLSCEKNLIIKTSAYSCFPDSFLDYLSALLGFSPPTCLVLSLPCLTFLWIWEF